MSWSIDIFDGFLWSGIPFGLSQSGPFCRSPMWVGQIDHRPRKSYGQVIHRVFRKYFGRSVNFEEMPSERHHFSFDEGFRFLYRTEYASPYCFEK